MSENFMVYSIQRTYIVNLVSRSGKPIMTCNQRIDIPTIEPLSQMQPAVSPGLEFALTVVPCIELSGKFLAEYNLTLETNEGATVLPIKLYPLANDPWDQDPEDVHPLENPYKHIRYVLVLPRGSTGVKSCKLIHKATGEEVQHNFTFGITPPPYNYDNALFGVISTVVYLNSHEISVLKTELSSLKLYAQTPTFAPIELPKGAGKQTITVSGPNLFYETEFNYSSSPRAAITHKPKITLHVGGRDFVYTLSLDRTRNTVFIDLLTGMITVYDRETGEIMKQFKLNLPYEGFTTLSFEDFDDIDDNVLRLTLKGARVV